MARGGKAFRNKLCAGCYCLKENEPLNMGEKCDYSDGCGILHCVAHWMGRQDHEIFVNKPNPVVAAGWGP